MLPFVSRIVVAGWVSQHASSFFSRLVLFNRRIASAFFSNKLFTFKTPDNNVNMLWDWGRAKKKRKKISEQQLDFSFKTIAVFVILHLQPIVGNPAGVVVVKRRQNVSICLEKWIWKYYDHLHLCGGPKDIRIFGTKFYRKGLQ